MPGFAGRLESAAAGGTKIPHSQFLIPNCTKYEKRPSVPLGTKGLTSAVPPKFVRLAHALAAPVTEGGPAVSPRRLPGEQTALPRIGLQPAAGPLWAGRNPLFSRSSLMTINTYSTEKTKMQAPVR